MNIENVKEAIETGVKAVTVDIPVRVTMTSYNNAPFEFTPSIDEVGQIVLTPTSRDVEFIAAATDTAIDTDVSIMEQETIETSEGSVTTKETSIMIKAGMLAEVDNYDFSAVVDEIGQVVIYPTEDKNVFVTASFEDSLNLVTEDLETLEYFGYKFVNNGDGWDVYDYTGELIDEGVATLAEAKILACTNEIHILEEITEDVDRNTDDDSDKPEEDLIDKKTPEVEAEVLEEAVTDASVEPEQFTRQQIEDAIETITDKFKEESGAVKCDTEFEQVECSKILSQHYANVTGEKKNDQWIVLYSELLQNDEVATQA